jgi:hypothetical protein
MEVYCENPADYIFVDVDAEGEGDLLGNACSPKYDCAVSFQRGVDQFFRRSFGTGRRTRLGETTTGTFA